MAKGRKTGGGSRRGIPNKVTVEARKVIAAFAESHAEAHYRKASGSGLIIRRFGG